MTPDKQRSYILFWVPVIASLTVIINPASIFAHPGPINSDGGHYNTITKEYHFHENAPAIPKKYSISNDKAPEYRQKNPSKDPTMVRNSALVKEVVNGNTLIVIINGRIEKIRIPVLVPNGVPKGDDCKTYLNKLISGKAVILEHHNVLDKEGYLLADIIWNDFSVSKRMREYVDNQY